MHTFRHFVLSVAVLLSIADVGLSQSESKYLNDSGDWWSLIRREEEPLHERITPRATEPNPANFQIAGISLTSRDIFADVNAKFGPTTQVDRGDAASGRHQVCYISPSGDTLLIFELGEVEIAAYLFRKGQGWKGQEYCSRSNKVVADSATASGLQLGMTPEQVKRVLGSPNISDPERLVYSFEFRKNSSAEELAEFRKDNPQMTDEEFHRNFDYYEVEAYIEARFSAGKLSYLALSRTEAY